MRLQKHSCIDINKVIHRNTDLALIPIQIKDLTLFLLKHLNKPPQLNA